MTSGTAGDLFDGHRAVVYGYLRRMTGDAALADDLTGEVFVRVVRGLSGYRPQDRERAWVLTIARNVLLDQRKRLRPVLVGLDEADLYAGTGDPQQETRVRLGEALAALDEPEREAFLLREVGGLGYVEIGAATGTTPDAVRSRIFRARQSLRVLLSGELESARRMEWRQDS